MAATVRRTVAAEFPEMYGIVHFAELLPVDRVADLVGTRAYAEFLAAESEHLGHERHSLELPLRVERPENVLLGAHSHTIASTEGVARFRVGSGPHVAQSHRI